MGLTEEQECLVEEVLIAAKNREKLVFIVQGGPGSGKTLIAVTLLLRALREKIRRVLAIRNNRLQAILRRCFEINLIFILRKIFWWCPVYDIFQLIGDQSRYSLLSTTGQSF
jgi:hypothetical protein